MSPTMWLFLSRLSEQMCLGQQGGREVTLQKCLSAEHQEQPGEGVLSLGKGGEGGRASHPEVTLSYSRDRPELDKMAWPQ